MIELGRENRGMKGYVRENQREGENKSEKNKHLSIKTNNGQKKIYKNKCIILLFVIQNKFKSRETHPQARTKRAINPSKNL